MLPASAAFQEDLSHQRATGDPSELRLALVRFLPAQQGNIVTSGPLPLGSISAHRRLILHL